MSRNFVHLHVHSDFSMLDGLGKIRDYVARATELKMPALALSDHGTVSGCWEHYTACRKAGIQPILAVEGYFHPTATQAKELKDRDRYHITLLARNREGFKTLTELITESNKRFYTKPLLERSLLESLGDEADNLVCLSGCAGSIISKEAMKSVEEGLDEAKWWKSVFRNFFIEIMAHGSTNETKLNNRLLKIGRRLNIEPVITNDPHYVHKEEHAHHDALLAIQVAADIDDPARFHFDGRGFHLRSRKELDHAFRKYRASVVATGLDNTLRIAEMCRIDIPEWNNKAWHIPRYPKLPDKYEGDSDRYLRRLVSRSLRERGLDTDPRYLQRAESELEAFAKINKMADFLLITYEALRWARKRNIEIGPGRGSITGSLVAYLLNIHELDSVRYKLLFERFLNPERPKAPDVDSDFEPDGRPLVIQHYADLYGAENVMRVAAFQCLHGESKIYDWDAQEYLTVHQAYKQQKRIRIACYNEQTGKTVPNKVLKFVRTTGQSERKMSYKLTLTSGRSVICSAEHKFLTNQGWKPLKKLLPTDKVACEKRHWSTEQRRAQSKRMSKMWASLSDKEKEKYLEPFKATWGTGSEKWKEWYASLPEAEKERRTRERLANLEKNPGDWSWRKQGVGPCGQYVSSINELWVCKWLHTNQFKHDHQVYVGNGKIADFKCQGVFIEIDGIDRDEEYFDQKFGYLPVVVIKHRRDIERDLSFLFDEEFVRTGETVVFTAIKSIKPYRPISMYDVIMDGKPHNYLANGIVVHNTMHVAGVFQTLARAHGISPQDRNRLTKELGQFSTDDEDDTEDDIDVLPEEIREGYPDMAVQMRHLLGTKRAISRHAAGVIIFDPQDSIKDLVGLQWLVNKSAPGGGNWASQFDLKTVAGMNLMKQDTLGLRTLATIKECVRLVRKNHGVELDYRAWIPDEEPDDDKIYAMLAEGNTAGIFQAEGPSNTRGLREVGPTCFEDLSTITALYRKGPIDAGSDKRFLKNRNDNKIRVIHPALKPILDLTWGEMIYDEQMLQILHDVAGLSWSRTDDVKNAMKLKDPKMMAEIMPDVIEGLIKNAGMKRKQAERVRSMIEAQSSYLFSRNHAIAYSLSTYRTARLKYLYPLEYMTALVQTVKPSSPKQKIRRMNYVAEISESFKVLPPDINQSEAKATCGWIDGKGWFRFGLTDCSGIGDSKVEKLLSARQTDPIGFFGVDDVEEAIDKGTFKVLTRVGALESIGGPTTSLRLKQEIVGYRFSDPMKKLRKKFAKKMVLPEEDKDYVRIYGEITSVEHRETRNGKSFTSWIVQWSPTTTWKVQLWDDRDGIKTIRKGTIVRVEGEWSAEWSNVGVNETEGVQVIRELKK